MVSSDGGGTVVGDCKLLLAKWTVGVLWRTMVGVGGARALAVGLSCDLEKFGLTELYKLLFCIMFSHVVLHKM